MKYLVLLASLIFVGCKMTFQDERNVSSIYPVREPFEYVMTTGISADEGYLITEMTKTCKSSFTITETQNGSGFRLIYFKCNVRN